MLIKRVILLGSALCGGIFLAGCTTVSLEPTPAPSPAPIIVVPDVPVAPQPAQPAQPSTPTQPTEIFKASTFDALPGWEKDDLREAWPAFLASCNVLIKKTEWQEVCSVAKTVNGTDQAAIRTFFESFLLPHRVIGAEGNDSGLVTGYYEPLLRGARKRGGPYQTAIHRVPDDLLTVDLGSVYPDLKNMRLRGRLSGNKIAPYPARAELNSSGLLDGKELVWVDDPIDAFFLQVQGSGRVYLSDSNETIRVAYGDQNGHPYKSIGRFLVDKKELKLEQASMQGIRSWLAINPTRQAELLNANPSYVFFKEEKLLDPKVGPKGALGVPLTGQRSVAVDPQFLPLGVPLFLATTQPNSEQLLQRLMMAQDTGGAIRGANRVDFFWGFGAEAGEKAGRMKQRGQVWILLPKSASKLAGL
jgi:membrane-bound lytic murein transglycosylase A